MSGPLLQVDGLVKHYPLGGGWFAPSRSVQAVDGVSFDIMAGETLGLVGESGCGKSSVARCIVRLTQPTAGRIMLDGCDITQLSPAALRPLRRRLQIVFQDPFASLDPRQKAGAIVAEPLVNYGVAQGDELRERVRALFARVGLRPDQAALYPHEFSGGQRQRLGIARALALMPDLIICDEPVSALDVSIQAQVINLLGDLQRDLGLAYLFVAHDLAVVAHVSHRVAVMYLGRIVEIGPGEAIFTDPLHPYTRALLASVPGASAAVALPGEPPSPMSPPPGCRFHTRCPMAMAQCRVEAPALRPSGHGSGHLVACHLR